MKNGYQLRPRKNPVTVFITKPERPVFDVKLGDAPVQGEKSAKVTIIEFTDFQCPFCKKAHDIVKKVKKKYGKKVSLAIKHYPLPFHKNRRRFS